MAHGGTLFLDEITDMSLRVQAKILRAIEFEEIQRIGGKELIKVDTRIIGASNRDIKEAIRDKTFREDLYYRLSVITIHLPPLRERKEDIPVLVEHFLRMFCEERKRPLLRLQPAALEVLLTYPWPGNVRELKNLIEKIVVLSPAELISREEVESFLQEASLGGHSFHPNPIPYGLSKAREKAEKELILAKLLANNWNYEKTAFELKISRATLFNKMKMYGLKR